jgi:hypothetical protein
VIPHQNKKVGYWEVVVNHHTTTPQYSIQRQPNTKKSSIDSIVQYEYFQIILGKVLFNTVTNRIEKINCEDTRSPESAVYHNFEDTRSPQSVVSQPTWITSH